MSVKRGENIRRQWQHRYHSPETLVEGGRGEQGVSVWIVFLLLGRRVQKGGGCRAHELYLCGGARPCPDGSVENRGLVGHGVVAIGGGGGGECGRASRVAEKSPR